MGQRAAHRHAGNRDQILERGIHFDDQKNTAGERGGADLLRPVGRHEDPVPSEHPHAHVRERRAHARDRAEELALAGVGVGIGNIFGSFVSGALRNPEAAPRVFGNVLLGFALTEAVALFALVIAFMILFVF